MDPVTILTAFIPILQQGAAAVIRKVTGSDGTKPATVEEVVKLGELEIRKLEAIAAIDSAAGAAPWVANVRGIQRPLAVGLILLTYVVCVGTPGVAQETLNLVANLASSAMFYLFGDRTLMYINSPKGAPK
jgi:hypothetical protein